MELATQDYAAECRYSYARSFARSKQVAWTVEDLLENREFSRESRWLPPAVSAVQFLSEYPESFLTKLTQVEMASYAHLFGYV